jgi:hypothetical protein
MIAEVSHNDDFRLMKVVEAAVSCPSNGIGKLLARAELSHLPVCSTCKSTKRLRDNKLCAHPGPKGQDATTCMNETKWRQLWNLWETEKSWSHMEPVKISLRTEDPPRTKSAQSHCPLRAPPDTTSIIAIIVVAQIVSQEVLYCAQQDWVDVSLLPVSLVLKPPCRSQHSLVVGGCDDART